MKMRVVERPTEEFEAEISTEHPASIPGPLSFKRKDTGEYLSVRDCFGLPGTPFKRYDLLEISTEERSRLEAGGLMIV